MMAYYRQDNGNVILIIIGQECICPDGLGRVAEVVETDRSDIATKIKVNTYMNNRGCHWDIYNISLIRIGEKIK